MTGFPGFCYLLEFAQILSIELVMLFIHLILCYPLLLRLQSFLAPGSFPVSWPFILGGWSNGASAFNVHSNEYLALISFRIDCFDLPALHKSFKGLLQHHSLKASILQCSVFFMVQLSHLYMTNGKTIALTIQTFISKVMSPLFNMLSSFSELLFQEAAMYVSLCCVAEMNMIL